MISNLKRIAMLAPLALSLVACSVSDEKQQKYAEWVYENHVKHTEIKTPDNKRGFVITCNDWQGAVSWADCFRRANEVCGGKYNVFDRVDEQRIFRGTSTNERSLFIECEST